MNPYINEEGCLCFNKIKEDELWYNILVSTKKYKVNKEGLFEEVTN
jgi:hypothetical protein